MFTHEQRVKRKWTVRWYHAAIGIVLIIPVAGIFVSCGGPAAGTTEWHYNQGYDLVEQGRYREAIEELNQAIELDPASAKAYNNRGSAYHYLDQHERAIQDFDKAIRLNPDYALAYYNRGSTYHHLDQHERAVQDFNEAIRLNPEYALVYYNQGSAYKELGKKTEAIANFEKFIILTADLRSIQTAKQQIEELSK